MAASPTPSLICLKKGVVLHFDVFFLNISMYVHHTYNMCIHDVFSFQHQNQKNQKRPKKIQKRDFSFWALRTGFTPTTFNIQHCTTSQEVAGLDDCVRDISLSGELSLSQESLRKELAKTSRTVPVESFSTRIP